jgi:Uma2 family endonuclease
MTPTTGKIDLTEYYAKGERGEFADRNVELIDGEIIEKPMQGHDHSLAVELVRDALAPLFGSGCWVRVQMPLEFGSLSAPEPDVAVVAGSPRSYRSHPRTALLVVEVSDSTLATDRFRKASLYATAGIEDYWIVNLEDRRLEIYRLPVPDATCDFGYGYASVLTVLPADSATPLALPNARVRVSDLLP